MAPKTPRTERVVALVGDARRRLRIVFLADGRIDPVERQILREMDCASIESRWADQDRKERHYIEDYGFDHAAPSYHHVRLRRAIEDDERKLLDEPTRLRPRSNDDPKEAA